MPEKEHIRAAAWLEYENTAFFSELTPLFEQALADSSITAWVGCDDAVAMMAWSLLTARGISIPERIALAGFGNTTQTFKADITSYDFNLEATARSIMMFLLRPTMASRVRRLARPRIEGYIIERRSTSRQVASSC